MKKKILFIEEGLGIGGAEKSLLAILNLLDYSKYEVDLFLFRHTGEFMNMLPKEVNFLKASKDFALFEENKKVSPLNFFKKHNVKATFYSSLYLINSGIYKIKKEHIKNKEYIGWNFLKNLFKPLEKEYDVAISFLEKKTIYFNVDKVKAKRRIGFVHIDYSNYPYNYKMDKKYFKEFNNIVTVSNHCKEVLENIFPEYKEKFLVIKNMILVNLIEEKAKEKVRLKEENEETIKIVTVGRLVNQKGIDNGIFVCKALIDEGYKVRWYVVGKGKDKEKLENLIKTNNLEENFILLGAKTNPYKYIKICDIYVQPSRFEGYGITVAEAKALKKPIVATDIPEFREQIINKKTGILCKDNNELKCGIKLLIEDKNLRKKLIDNLKKENEESNTLELKKLYEIIEGKNLENEKVKSYG